MTASRRYLSLEELCVRLERGPQYVENLLAESVRMGVVELVGDGYRLTAEAERCYGADLRELGEQP